LLDLPYIGTLNEKRRLNFLNKLLDVTRLARLFCDSTTFFLKFFYYFYSILFSNCVYYVYVCMSVCLSAVISAPEANKDIVFAVSLQCIMSPTCNAHGAVTLACV